MSESFQVTGTLHAAQPVQTFGSGFTKRVFVLELEPESRYPQLVPFELVKDNCSLLDGVPLDSTIAIKFNLRGREWTSPKGEVKYFGNCECWQLEVVGKAEEPVDVELNTQDEIPF